ncbi:MAG: hypothetical protein IPM45_11785 [Acidimicrobiales bacterium]|nr:hypothetical protein [Acidimicrobiales bacterium]
MGVLASAVVNLVLLVAIAALVVGGVAGFRYAVRANRRGPSGAGGERIDPFAVGEPWRRYVADALQARTRFGDAVAGVRSGPVRDRLVEVQRRLEEGVRECWAVARRGAQLDRARDAVQADAARAELVRLESGEVLDADPARVEALRGRVASFDRLTTVEQDSLAKLRVLQARLDEVVARGIELSMRTDDVDAAASLGGEVDDVVLELEALRQALEETGAGG